MQVTESMTTPFPGTAAYIYGTVAEPLVAPPVENCELVKLVALVLDHVTVALWLGVMIDGATLNVTTGRLCVYASPDTVVIVCVPNVVPLLLVSVTL